MTIEATMERIAVALERLAGNAGTTAPAPAAAVEPDKRTVGRPRKEAAAPAPAAAAPAPAAAAAPATPAVEATNDFLSDDKPAAQLTREMVREALVKYQKANTPEAARAILKTVGGADTLVKLSEDKFAAVIEAAKV